MLLRIASLSLFVVSMVLVETMVVSLLAVIFPTWLATRVTAMAPTE